MITSFPNSDDQARRVMEQLTDREKQMLLLVIEGAHTKEIAERLQLSRTTVSTYKGRLMTKLHVKSESHLALLAVASALADLHGAQRHLESLSQLAA